MTRWTRRLLAGAIAILVPALAGCEAGLDAPTLQYHPATFGVSTQFDGIAIDNLFVLGPALNSTLPAGGQAGVFMALSAPTNEQLTSVSASGTANSVQLMGGPITLSPGTLVNLGGPTPSIVLNGLTAPLAGGETVHLTLNFANAGAVTLSVPVEPNSYEYSTFSAPAPSPSPSASPSASGKHKVVKPKPSGTPSGAVTGTATPFSTPSPSASS